MNKKVYDEQTIIDFLKMMEKSKLITKGAHKNPSVVKNVKECCELTDDEVKAYNNQSVQMIHGEFTDWIETYTPKKK